MDIGFKAGRASVTVIGGWLVDRETSTHHYTTQESDPIYQTTTHLTHYREEYLDSDGDIRERRWTTSEDRTEQVGSHDYRVARESTIARYRIAYDDGTGTQYGSHPTHAGYGDRVHRYSITHPLLRAPITGVLYAMATMPRHLTPWQRLVTLSARRAVGRAVERDRREKLEAVSRLPRRAEERSLHHLLVDGTWDAARRRVRTTQGEHALPRAGRITDGATVGLLLRDRGFSLPLSGKGGRLVVDGWATLAGRAWTSTRKPLIEKVWQTRVPVAIGLLAIAMAAAAIPLRSDPLIILAGLTAVASFLGFRRRAESREAWLDGFHAGNVRHSFRMLRRGHWVAAMHAAGKR